MCSNGYVQNSTDTKKREDVQVHVLTKQETAMALNKIPNLVLGKGSEGNGKQNLTIDFSSTLSNECSSSSDSDHQRKRKKKRKPNTKKVSMQFYYYLKEESKSNIKIL